MGWLVLGAFLLGIPVGMGLRDLWLLYNSPPTVSLDSYKQTIEERDFARNECTAAVVGRISERGRAEKAESRIANAKKALEDDA